MFKLVWKQVVSATAVAFTTIDDDYIIEKAISGFRQCATLASTFQLPEVFDFIVLSLSYATSLLEDSVPPKTSSFPVVEVEGQGITVSPLSVKFGTSLRAQLAAVVMFTISNGNGNHLKEGWAPVSVLRA
jgi:golgi-specific brefeldin A-resistance guanine nucleotide exchange factor 1